MRRDGVVQVTDQSIDRVGVSFVGVEDRDEVELRSEHIEVLAWAGSSPVQPTQACTSANPV